MYNGIPILGQQYYNTYSLSGANIIGKERFFAYPYNIPSPLPDDHEDDFPRYYSTRIINDANVVLLERLNLVRPFGTKKESAQNGYYPDINSNSQLLENLISDNLYIDAKVTVEGAGKLKIEISGGTFVDKIYFVRRADGSTVNKNYFYNTNNTDIQEVTNIGAPTYNASTNTYTIIARIDNSGLGGGYSIFIRDIDGRTKLVTKIGVLGHHTVVPTIHLSLAGTDRVHIDANSGGSGTGYTTELKRNGITISSGLSQVINMDDTGLSPGTYQYLIIRYYNGTEEARASASITIVPPVVTPLEPSASVSINVKKIGIFYRDINVDINNNSQVIEVKWEKPHRSLEANKRGTISTTGGIIDFDINEDNNEIIIIYITKNDGTQITQKFEMEVTPNSYYWSVTEVFY